ncbi:MAG: c-type cytochrome [Rubrivivax sp.]|nr:c-type cytochrome [Rubrivivax sp.]
MLRESRARWLAFATAGVVVALAALFAWLRNPPGDATRTAAPTLAAAPPTAPATPASAWQGAAPVPQAPPADAARLAAGRAAFTRLGCGGCHAIDGVGNPAAPLDGVGARLDPAALRDWTLGAGVAVDQLPRGLLRTKARAAQDADIDVLIEYLAQSR